ncbi:MAG: hypothetical protein AAFO70_04815 [Pseudomonadota bacterium]
MNGKTAIALTCGLAIVAASAVFLLPGDRNSGHVIHSGHGDTAASAPREAGQSAFAALSEIVSLLSADPTTDWSKVEIDALRRHLVDMSEVTLNARVERELRPDSLRFIVTGAPRTVAAIKRMVPAHAAVMNEKSSARFETEVIENGVVLTLRNLSDAERSKFEALGFFGFMATGAHHQPHHLAMARGEPVHLH